MERHRKQLARTLVLASALIAAAAAFLLPPSLQAQTQVQSNGIDPALLAKANAGDANAQYNLGVNYETGLGAPQDHMQAAIWFRKAAEKGMADAQYYLAMLYHRGDGVSQDYVEAVTWCRKAAEQGLAEAQFSLGVSYYGGEGLPQNYAQAASWFRKAAEQGNAGAQFWLGLLYNIGIGVPQDYAEAYFWLDIAATGKIEGTKQEDIAMTRDDAASHLNSTTLLRTQERARRWFAEHPAKP